MLTPQTTLHKVESLRVFEQAVEQIRKFITQNQLRPGQKLPTQQELAAALHVSRSSLREALRVLEAEGLIEVRRGAGAFIAPLSGWYAGRNEAMHWIKQRQGTLLSLLQVRESIEGLTAALAAMHASPEILSELGAIVKQQMAHAANNANLDDLTQLDVRFHLLIGQTSGNSIAYELLLHLVPSFYQSNKAILFAAQRIDEMLRGHENVLDGLRSRDSARAEKAMRAHIAFVRTEILEL